MQKRQLLVTLLGSLVTAAQPLSAAHAQANWPEKPIKLIVPYSPGGPVDTIGRTIAPGLSEALGQPVVVDNKAGAGGSIGLNTTIKAAPDGYTIGFGVPGAISVLPHLQPLPYDVKEINYVSLVVRVPQVIAVGPDVKANSLKELIELAKQNPGKLNYASAGKATTTHLGAELLQQVTGISMVHVPYKGAAPAMTGMLGGEVQVFLADLPAVLPFVSKGVKIIAVNGSHRVEALPNVPTTAELGYPKMLVEGYYGIVAPTGTPAAITSKLQAALVKVVNDPAVSKQLKAMGMVPSTTTPQEYQKLMEDESVKWAEVLKKGNITLQ